MEGNAVADHGHCSQTLPVQRFRLGCFLMTDNSQALILLILELNV